MPLQHLMLDSQSPPLLDFVASMLHAYWLTDADEIYSSDIEILYRMTKHFSILKAIQSVPEKF